MKQPRTLLIVAALMYAVSWFLPIAKHGTTLSEGGLPGWEAFTLAMAQPWEGFRVRSSMVVFLSGLSNVWFLASIGILLFRPKESKNRIPYGGLVLCVIVNFFWLLEPTNLRVGYYLWLGSFLLLAMAAYQFSNERSNPLTAA